MLAMNLLISSLRSAGKVGGVDTYAMPDYRLGSRSRRVSRNKAWEKRHGNRMARRFLKAEIAGE
jgi:hypothetical protein